MALIIWVPMMGRSRGIVLDLAEGEVIAGDP